MGKVIRWMGGGDYSKVAQYGTGGGGARAWKGLGVSRMGILYVSTKLLVVFLLRLPPYHWRLRESSSYTDCLLFHHLAWVGIEIPIPNNLNFFAFHPPN